MSIFMSFLDDKSLKYTKWDHNEPESRKWRDCAIFGSKSEFNWQASVCEEFPYDYKVICQYGESSIFHAYLSYSYLAKYVKSTK